MGEREAPGQPGDSAPDPRDAPEPVAAVGPPPVRLLEGACPYLVAKDGRWRSASPTPEHRCAAVEPPAPLALAKQRRLCLDERHRTCSTFLAAQGALGDGARPSTTGRGSRWRYAVTTPLVLDGGPRFGLLGDAGGRLGQAALVVLVVAAFGVLVLARQATEPGDTAAASLSPPVSPLPSLAPTPALPTPTPLEPSPAPTSSPAASAEPSSPAPASPTPAASVRTYRVRAGDTLSAIAARFGTTVRAIAELNGISDPSRIRVGQILRIP
ncbi:MAG TPA: LysM domain-containing protein [Candidatus Binatia bacterium]|nr:LysM domain-containing protein [Candidatus Binatia bacterium]